MNLFFSKNSHQSFTSFQLSGFETHFQYCWTGHPHESGTSKWQQQEVTRWVWLSFLHFKKWRMLALPCYIHADDQMGKITEAVTWESSVQVHGSKGATFQLFIYLRSYQRWSLYKVIWWTYAALSGGWSDSLPVNHKGLLWNY